MAAIDNLLIAEDGIVARIKECMMTGPNAVLRTVLTAPDLASITEEKQIVPAAFVVFDGFGLVGQGVQLEYEATMPTRWITAISVKNVARARQSAARNQDAGPLLARLFTALWGFVPAQGMSPLIPVPSPRPYYGGGFAYYPLSWSTSLNHCRNF